MLTIALASFSSLSLKSGHVYSATFSDGPQPAVATSCVAYKVAPSQDYLRVSSSFGAGAGGEAWTHDSVLFKLTGTVADGEKALLRFDNVTAALAPFVLRISAPTVGPADSVTFKSTDDSACPSEHCLVPAVANLPGHVYTPKCGFGTVGVSVEQPISPNLPSGTPLLVDVTSLVRDGARTLKVALVHDHQTKEGFWGGKLQLSGAQLVTQPVTPPPAVEAVIAGGACSATDQAAINAKPGGTADGSFPKLTMECGRKALSIFSGISESKFNQCLQGELAVSTGCSDCFYKASQYGYENCKLACLKSWCSAGCLQCAANFDTDGCAGFAAPAPTAC